MAKTDRETLQWIDGFLKGKLSLTAAEKEIQKLVEQYLKENGIKLGSVQLLLDGLNVSRTDILKG